MQVRLSDRIADWMAQTAIIRAEDKELYAFGLRNGAFGVLGILSMLAVGFLLGMLWQAALFYAAYAPLRSYAGGVHAKTPLRCYFYSIALMAAVLLLMQYVVWDDLFVGVATFVAVALVYAMAPVEDPNKPISPEEAAHFRPRARIIAIALAVITAVFLLLGLQEVALCIAASVVTVGVMLIVGIGKNRLISFHS